MTWAPKELQLAVYNTLSESKVLANALGSTIPNEVQLIAYDLVPDAGSYQLDLNVTNFINVDFGDSALDIQTAIRLLTGYGQATVTGDFSVGHTIDFIGDSIRGPQDLITVSLNTLMNIADPVAINVSRSTIGSLVMVPQRAFEFVPDNYKVYPYLTFNIFPMSDRANRTWDGVSFEFQISIWDERRSNSSIHILQNIVDDLFHQQSICVEGWNVVSLRRTFTDVLRDPDNVTRQGIQRFLIRLGRNSYQA